jgi:hypothetical protein
LLRCDELLAEYGDERAVASRALVADALRTAPGACVWARQFLASTGPLNPRSIPLMSDAIIRTAVVGIADACIEDPDDRLRDLLTAAIADSEPLRTNTMASRIAARELQLSS